MRRDISRLREQYPKGSRVELVEMMEDPYHPIPAGSKGTVWAVDDAGQIHVNWDEGGSLALIYGVDSFRKVGNIEQNSTEEKTEVTMHCMK